MTQPSMLPEADRLTAEPVGVALSNGTSVNLLRLRTRQLFKLLKIVTRGAGPGVVQILNLESLTPENAGDFALQLATVVFMSVPEAENETIAFVSSMVEPGGLYTKPRLSKQEQEHNDRLWAQLAAFLDNPPIEDTVDIIEAIFRQEAPELASLGKRVSQMLKLAGLTGQGKQESPEEVPAPQELAEAQRQQEREATPVSAVSSPETHSVALLLPPTTSSPVSTAGQTGL